MQETATSSRSSFLIEDLHVFMKISGVLAILAFVALHQNKMIDLVGILGIDSNLKNAFETLLAFESSSVRVCAAWVCAGVTWQRAIIANNACIQLLKLGAEIFFGCSFLASFGEAGGRLFGGRGRGLGGGGAPPVKIKHGQI